jgi:hypothetical protein
VGGLPARFNLQLRAESSMWGTGSVSTLGINNYESEGVIRVDNRYAIRFPENPANINHMVDPVCRNLKPPPPLVV